MGYTSNDLFFDEGELSYMFSSYLRKLIFKLKEILKKISDVDYYHTIVNILTSLPEALIILYLGFFATYNLLKFSESTYGNKFFPIITSSMDPAITPGSLVYSVTTDTYEHGDIISYVERTDRGINTGKILTHRIVEKNDNGTFLTKGDANKDKDPRQIEKEQIRGKVALVIPYLGYIELLTKTLPGFITLILIPSGLLITKQLKIVRSNIRSR